VAKQTLSSISVEAIIPVKEKPAGVTDLTIAQSNGEIGCSGRCERMNTNRLDSWHTIPIV
jgi:hypothetical protein